MPRTTEPTVTASSDTENQTRSYFYIILACIVVLILAFTILMVRWIWEYFQPKQADRRQQQHRRERQPDEEIGEVGRRKRPTRGQSSQVNQNQLRHQHQLHRHHHGRAPRRTEREVQRSEMDAQIKSCEQELLHVEPPCASPVSLHILPYYDCPPPYQDSPPCAQVLSEIHRSQIPLPQYSSTAEQSLTHYL